MDKTLHMRNVWVRGWSGEWYMTNISGAFDANGDFLSSDGIWIARKADNAGHPAFA